MPISRKRRYSQTDIPFKALKFARKTGVLRRVAPAAAAAAALGAAAYMSKGDPIGQYRKYGRRGRGKSDAQNSRSGGKFSRKKKKNIFDIFSKKGVVTTLEHGTVLSGATGAGTSPSLPVYCGHSTHGNVRLIQRVFWRSLVRDIFQQIGNYVADIETDSPGSYNLFVGYTTNLNNADAELTVNCAGKSYNSIAGDLDTAFRAVYETLAGQSFIQIKDVTVTDGARVCGKRDYSEARVTILVKSDLKIQNRTLASGTDTNNAENVSNQPLYGKSYSGKGNGLVCKIDTTAANAGKSLTVGENTGILSYQIPNLTAAFWLNEAPLPTLFSPKPKYSRASIEPGTVKTSSLTKKVSMKMSDFWQMIQAYPQGTSKKGNTQQTRYGIYHIFALEKMITVSSDDTVPVLGLETNQRCGLYLTFPRAKYSAEVVEGQAFI